MTDQRAFITGCGVISPLGRGLDETAASLYGKRRGIGPLTLFTPYPEYNLPVGQVHAEGLDPSVPRTHALALLAAADACAGNEAPDAIVVGTTTGGIAASESALRDGNADPAAYRCHATSTIGELIASRCGCLGPVITVSTACSSGSAVLKIALELIRSGKANRVLAGGADCLCRLTYYGFNSLQLIDPQGARPLDGERRGMSVSEGAGFLYLEGGAGAPVRALGEVLGCGMSCDAHHPAAPHPEGKGALAAMRRALADAGIEPAAVDYINLHGTGTVDNDLAESKAVRALFGERIPAHSSTKGATGHSLGAVGAIEAAIALIALREGMVPANVGCTHPDPALGLNPALEPVRQPVRAVLSNSFGFGGNNACVVIGGEGRGGSSASRSGKAGLAIKSFSCLTGAGTLAMTMDALRGGVCAGMPPADELTRRFSPREVRRVKKLSRIVLTLAADALDDPARGDAGPDAVYFGTGWGALSETSDFLRKLFETGDQFASPTDFVGSVHNAPAGQVAIKYGATGPNLTATGGDYCFEQALWCARLFAPGAGGDALVMGADEYHPDLSDLFDASVRAGAVKSEGGGALLLGCECDAGPRIAPLFFRSAADPAAVAKLVDALRGYGDAIGTVFAGIPLDRRGEGERLLGAILAGAGIAPPVFDYRPVLGEYASVAATAAAIAARCVREGIRPDGTGLDGRGILLLGLGAMVTATMLLP